MRSILHPTLLLLLAACVRAPVACQPVTPAPAVELPRGPVQLLVERFTPGGVRDFAIMEPDGSRLGTFAPMPREVLRVVPSPDGRTLALLVQEAVGDVNLWLADRDGRNRRLLLAVTGEVSSVAWSPDSRRLAAGVSTLDVVSDVFVIGADGTGLVDLTPDPQGVAFYDADPAWSPDGSRLVFSSNRSGTYTHLWTVPLSGGEPLPVLAAQESTERRPAWAPDGSRIAFLGGLAGTPAGVGLVAPDGSGYQVLATVGRPDSLSWSPDGRLLYASAASGASDLYALDPATGTSENLTRTSARHEVGAVAFRAAAVGPWLGVAPVASLATGRPAAQALALADLDGDGDADLASLLPAGDLRLLEGQGDGTLRDAGALAAPAGPRALLAASTGTGGEAELAALGEGHLSVWSASVGGPGTAELLALGGTGRGLAAGDFHFTGQSQLAAMVEGADGLLRLLLFGRGATGAMQALVDGATGVPHPGQACAADVTGEGTLDLVVTSADPAAPLVLVATEGISFQAPVGVGSGLAVDPSVAPVCADLDGDGRAEVLLLRPGLERGLALLPSTGTGLGPALELPVSGTALAAGDLDQDGDVDLVVAREAPGALLFLRNLGGGHLAAPVPLFEGGAPRALAVADLDGDGLLDLAIAHADGSLSTWRNLGRVPPR